MAGEVAPAATENTSQPEQAAVKSSKPTLDVKVYAPFKVYYEGPAISLSAVNDTGPFDVLVNHHNFLCMLVPCNLIIQTGETEQTVKINRALMHVKANRVVVFIDV
jgi:F0F1-type ATP synthase epsilon subunit